MWISNHDHDQPRRETMYSRGYIRNGSLSFFPSTYSLVFWSSFCKPIRIQAKMTIISENDLQVDSPVLQPYKDSETEFHQVTVTLL